MTRNETIQNSTSQSLMLKQGDEIHMTNGAPVSMCVRVTPQCGAEFEVELSPGAAFRVQVGNAPLKVDVLPSDNAGMRAVK